MDSLYLTSQFSSREKKDGDRDFMRLHMPVAQAMHAGLFTCDQYTGSTGGFVATSVTYRGMNPSMNKGRL